MKNIFIFSLILFIVGLSSIYSQSDPYSGVARFNFGKYLFQQGDFLRAYGEFNYYLENDTSKYLSAISLREMGRIGEANDRLRGLIFNSPLSEKARYQLYRNAFLTGDEYFLRENRSSLYFPLEYSSNIDKLTRFDYLLKGDIPFDEVEFLQPFEGSLRDTVSFLFKARKYPQTKNPVKAAWLSAIIPGAGKIYTKDYGDGITAFLMVGLFTYLAIDNFDAGHEFRGALFTGLAGYFYAGNIYGSYSSAQIFNVKYRTNISESIKKLIESVDYFSPGGK